MEKKSNESMPKSEEQAAEQMKISMASSIELKRINAVLETLNEGHKLNKVRTFGFTILTPLFYTINAINAYLFMIYVPLLPLSVCIHRPVTPTTLIPILHPPPETWVPHISHYPQKLNIRLRTPVYSLLLLCSGLTLELSSGAARTKLSKMSASDITERK